MGILFFALFILINSLAPSLLTSVVENCVKPTCICSYVRVYHITTICHTEDLKNDLRNVAWCCVSYEVNCFDNGNVAIM